MKTIIVVLAFCSTAACIDRVKAEANMRQRRLACDFQAGAMPEDTIGDTTFIGDKMPIDHIVLVMQENRSFDHYFSKLTHGGVRVAPEDVELEDRDGNKLKRHHEKRLCIQDITHSWNGSHLQWNDGKNDGFARAAGGDDPGRALGYYDETDLPYYYGLARTFALSDSHHAALLGPTWPNRMFYTAASSFGLIKNGLPSLEGDEVKANLFEALAREKVDFKIYITDAPTMLMYVNTYTKLAERVLPVSQYFEDAAAGKLPQVVMVEASYTAASKGNDEHPPRNMQRGQRFTADVANALMASPHWKRSVMFLTWDEHGGFYDHVPPPVACAPGVEPLLEFDSAPGHFDRLGFRVPLIAISPYAKRGYVSHVTSDLTGILRFVEARFGLPAFTARDANAEPLLDLFDFERPDFTVPVLPEALLDMERDALCTEVITL